MFPGIKAAKIVYWNQETAKAIEERFGKRFADDYEKDGVLFIGIGGGRLDDHAFPGECAATLCAKALGLDPAEDQALAKILKRVRRSDTQGRDQFFDVPYVAKLLYSSYCPERVLAWMMMAFEGIYADQQQFHGETAEEYRRMASIKHIPGPDDTLKVAIVDGSENAQLSRYARSTHGGRADLFIQRRTSGHVYIATRKPTRTPPDRVATLARLLRLFEQEKEGLMSVVQWELLGCNGKS